MTTARTRSSRFCIVEAMKVAEIELEDWAWTALQSAANRKGVSVSDLIRGAIEEKYLRTAAERVRAFRQWKAPWRDRDDIGETAAYVRQLREDDRLERLYPE